MRARSLLRRLIALVEGLDLAVSDVHHTELRERLAARRFPQTP